MPGSARLAHLSVRDFRNLAHVELAPPAEGLVVVGDNGQGKTNLLESIYYLEILRSVRGARDQDLVRFGADAFHIGARVDTDRVHDIGVGFERAGKRKRVRLDGGITEKLSDALGALPSVMFSPADVDLIAGAPSSRRRFLDIMLALTARGYLAALQRYRAALARRNATLREAARTGKATAASVAVWEPPLAQYGATLVRERRVWIDDVASRFERITAEIGEPTRVSMRYATDVEQPNASDAELAAAIGRALEEKRGVDLRRGLTHVGPHRDDLVISLTGADGAQRELRTFGSAGQQRSAAIALRMLEASTLTMRLGRAPVFLLDDPFAELDERRAANVLSLLTRDGLGQTILAVPRDTDIPREFTELERAHVAAGTITRFTPA